MTDAKSGGRPKVLLSEIMTAPVQPATTDMKLREVIEMMIKRGISGAPVVDSSGKIISMIGEGDSLRLAASNGLEATLAACLSHLPTVKQLVTLTRNHSFEDAYRVFLSHKFHRIPIVDGNGHLQGLITRSDILRLFVESHYGKKITRPRGNAA